MKKNYLLFFLACSIYFPGLAQLQPVYSFQKDDTILKKNFYEQSLKKKNTLLASVSKENAADYKKIYNEQYKEINDLWQSSRPVTSPEAQSYLQSIVQKIIAANTELNGTDARIVFTRDWWPNAYSMGDGTIAINAGLMIFLDNEAELVYIICHELAHYYLGHMQKTIKKYVETINSDSYKAEIKRLSKEAYRVNQQLEKFTKSVIFDIRRHSRENEAEADMQAFKFMKKTGYDCGAIKTGLLLLDKIDDSLIYRPLVLEQMFDFGEYSFKKKWITKESAIFSQLNEEDTPLSQKEKDSLKTHPDCILRVSLLEDSLRIATGGQQFLVDEKEFNQLKKDFFIEITEECYKEKKLSRNLYYSLLLLQAGENIPLAVYSVARCLNQVYENQKNHSVGNLINTESRTYPENYNVLLRMLSRLRLDEIATLNYYFCQQYQSQMKGYAGFGEEMNKAIKFKNLITY
ncbi:MAG TPA: M48 family metallopeptidase [Chitinophagaceae bacterium]|nr:M48 family metallopeptidase [Chitinophagaceae bacterium]